VLVAGLALALAKPGDLGDDDKTDRAASTTRPSATGSTTGTTTAGTDTDTDTDTASAQQTTAPTVTTPTTGGSATTTPTTARGATTTTVAPGGLGQSGAGGTGDHPETGGTSMLALGLVMVAAAFVLRRTATA